MKKYSEYDIEKMLSKTEKTEATFDKRVKFPENKIIFKRRFVPTLIAACLVLLILSASLIIAVFQTEDTQTNFSGIASESFDSDNSDCSYISLNDNTDNDYSDSYLESGETSVSEGDETREPFGNSDASSDVSGDVSDIESSLQAIVFPNDYIFFSDKGIGKLTPEEYFDFNPNKNLKLKNTVTVYTRNAITVEERKSKINDIARSLKAQVNFDEDLFKNTGDCRSTNNENNISISVGKYGDWFVSKSDGLIETVYIEDKIVPSDVKQKIVLFVVNHSDIFGEGNFEYSYVFVENEFEVRISVRGPDNVIAKLPQFVLSFKKISANGYLMTSVERNVNNMVSCGEYEKRTYVQALVDLLNSEITEDNDPDSHESPNIKFNLVGYDIRYLYSSYYAGIYPYYAFVLRLYPDGENEKYKVFFVPAINDEFVATYKS